MTIASRPQASLLAACLAVMLVFASSPFGSFALAQTGQAATVPPPDEKVQQLIKLLDDPDVRAWLATKPAPADDTAGAPTAEQISSWDQGIRDHLAAMRNALPQIPAEAANAVRTVRTEINNRGFATIIILFAALLALGFGAEWLFKRAIHRVRDNGSGRYGATTLGESRALHLLSVIAPIVVFSLVSAGAFLAFDWPALLRRIILTYLVAFIVVRLVRAFSAALLSPTSNSVSTDEARRLRLIPVNDAEADFWHRRLSVFFGYLMAGWATVSLLPDLGFSPGVMRLAAYILGIGLLALAIEIVWRRPGETGALRYGVVTNWLLTVYLVLLFGLWLAGFTGLLWLGIYALLLPKALTITGEVAGALAETRASSGSANSVMTVLIVRGARALVILLAVLWLGAVLRLNPGTLMQNDAVVTQLMRGVLRGVITLLVADLLWQLAKAYIARKLEIASSDEPIDAAEAARRGRLRTLLPIFRNMLAVLIAAVAVLMVLSELGVQIAPLIAGAGIFGVAIGFGSQTLVKDVISGVFYMLDDAFRVGEYIQSRSYKGTVESFSLRSVRLRHHRGPVFTVPFGELGAVENMSRDWAIDKFLIRVPFDTDIRKVKKLVKVIGAEMLEDPELAPQIIETVKMKGVEQFGDFGMELSFSITTKPGYQTGVRRRAYTMIRDTFFANGIEFAQPTVQVGNDEKSAVAAAASTTARARKAAQVAAAS
ncbi:mechanosensitive ion channel family protein [Mesorhizobium sp. YR577]|uniref:mechanosensitive ion channel family protein n=1 Tax=Mesorhizobium sp. YR577 TaxID=1884373 RepID=UPI0008E63893|nr:mechanosensitive ion channel family protein [Mesorhizobium sp. YR577]SFU20817.1 Small-conductance mechanosensitive channel [Mesorhizobium sp. YR577]